MRQHTTPQNLATDLDDSYQAHLLKRGSMIREDTSYYDGRGIVHREDYDLSEPHTPRHIQFVFVVEIEDQKDSEDLSWATAPASMIWEWNTEQEAQDVEFSRALIRTELHLTLFQLQRISDAEFLFYASYSYENLLQEIDA